MTERGHCHPSLTCVRCGTSTIIEALTNHCNTCGPDSFLRSSYGSRRLTLRGPPEQFLSYRDWLPFEPELSLPSLRMGCIRAPELAAHLGLADLWLILSGYAPELGADLPACTFKTLEAAGVLSRVLNYSDKTLIISSAGNTGCAVLELASRANVSAVVVVPEIAVPALHIQDDGRGPLAPMLIALRNATYDDAIALVEQLQERLSDRVVREGGAYNVARRDAMGVPMLRAVQAIGHIPDHYFQAVGSGTGGIAAHEAVSRMANCGVTGGPMHLHLVQNTPFTPMVDAWKSGGELAPMSRKVILERLSRTYSSILANAGPPYAVAGGVRDILRASGGNMYAVSNSEARAGTSLIAQHHGFEPYAEAGVAFAGLMQAARAGVIANHETVVVHVTGVGWERACEDLGKRPYPVSLTMNFDDLDVASDAVEQYLDRRVQQTRQQ